MHVGVLVKPLIVHVAGAAVETLCAPSTTVPPPVHVTVTLTEDKLAGTQTLFTVNVVLVWVLMIVQPPKLSGRWHMFVV